MKILILTVGRPKDKRLLSLAEEYLTRIRPSGLVAWESVPDVAGTNSADCIEREGQELLRRFRDRDRIILLREDGREYDSVAFSSFLSHEIANAPGRVLMVIGGPWGTGDSIKKRADAGLSLSKMTFTHEMCFLFLAEQLYRAFSIAQGSNYHKGLNATA